MENMIGKKLKRRKEEKCENKTTCLFLKEQDRQTSKKHDFFKR